MELILAAIVALIVLAGIHPGREQRQRLTRRTLASRARHNAPPTHVAHAGRMAATLNQPKRTAAQWWLN